MSLRFTFKNINRVASSNVIRQIWRLQINGGNRGNWRCNLDNGGIPTFVQT